LPSRRKNRLVTLDIDHQIVPVQPQDGGGLSQAVAPRSVVVSGHDGLAAESGHTFGNAAIIGGDRDASQSRNLAGLLINPLN